MQTGGVSSRRAELPFVPPSWLPGVRLGEQAQGQAGDVGHLLLSALVPDVAVALYRSCAAEVLRVSMQFPDPPLARALGQHAGRAGEPGNVLGEIPAEIQLEPHHLKFDRSRPLSPY